MNALPVILRSLDVVIDELAYQVKRLPAVEDPDGHLAALTVEYEHAHTTLLTLRRFQRNRERARASGGAETTR